MLANPIRLGLLSRVWCRFCFFFLNWLNPIVRDLMFVFKFTGVCDRALFAIISNDFCFEPVSAKFHIHFFPNPWSCCFCWDFGRWFCFWDFGRWFCFFRSSRSHCLRLFFQFNTFISNRRFAKVCVIVLHRARAHSVVSCDCRRVPFALIFDLHALPNPVRGGCFRFCLNLIETSNSVFWRTIFAKCHVFVFNHVLAILEIICDGRSVPLTLKLDFDVKPNFSGNLFDFIQFFVSKSFHAASIFDNFVRKASVVVWNWD